MTGFRRVSPARCGAALLITLALHSATAVGAGGILILGDSISAAYGIDKAQGWVALMEQRLAQQCPGVEVTNASVSGETTAGGLHRLPELLAQWRPQLVVIELGGNDGLRGLPPEPMANNLARMAQLARAADAVPVLLGMKIPPNYGPVYQRRFERAFARVAEDEKLPFVEFFLAGIGGDPDFIQADGIHPNAAAQPHLLRNAWGAIAPVLAAVADCEIDPRLAVAAGPVLAADRLGAFPFHAVAAGGQPQPGDAARIVYRLDVNRFRGVESLQLLIERIL
jgi:acyl-CoA thioesterase-1